ncbi:MAG: hypothetical protein HYY60_01285 [Parcubacteria group bacterium]|nr:hypothetical protein [Candidatus Liptonbacteria bacterium]MBI3019942.1 hypothetical protein [Parcubacteria group bacterium]MBI3075193.1 hypothetical protein [Parcubacteria group bacterium]
MQLTATQFEKLSGYFIDLAKVWFASGVIGFFITDTEKITAIIALYGFVASAVFLVTGLVLLKSE